MPTGYKWVCFQWNDYGNAARGPALRAACDKYGLVFTIWLTRTFDASSVRQALLASEADGLSLEA